MTLIENIDYFIHIVPFPVANCGGMVMPNDDGTFSIYINSLLSADRQREALRHELDHIINGDFYNERPIEQIERI